jgi:hypothetical protein
VGELNIAFLSMFAAFLLQPAPAAKTTHLYLLEDSPHQQWCGFADRKSWEAWLKDEKNYSLDNAIVDFVDGHISVIKWQGEAESGDSVVIDTYSFAGGAIRRLHRRMNVLPGDTTETQIFLIRNGKAKLQSTVIRRLSTGKLLKHSDSLMPQTDVVTDMGGFPFAPLLDAQHLSEIRAKKPSCVAAKQ